MINTMEDLNKYQITILGKYDIKNIDNPFKPDYLTVSNQVKREKVQTSNFVFVKISDDIFFQLKNRETGIQEFITYDQLVERIKLIKGLKWK